LVVVSVVVLVAVWVAVFVGVRVAVAVAVFVAVFVAVLVGVLVAVAVGRTSVITAPPNGSPETAIGLPVTAPLPDNPPASTVTAYVPVNWAPVKSYVTT
jgi:hypothetical protein